MIHELGDDDEVTFSAIAYASRTPKGARFNARIDHEFNDASAELAGLTGHGDTALQAMADLFHQADRLTSSNIN